MGGLWEEKIRVLYRGRKWGADGVKGENGALLEKEVEWGAGRVTGRCHMLLT